MINSSHFNTVKAIIKRGVHNRQLLRFGICLCIAAVFWYVEKLDRDYVQEVSMRVKFIEYPQDRVLVKEPPRALKIVLKANGYVLLKHVWGLNITPVFLNVSVLNPKPLYKGSTDYYVLTQSIRPLLEDRFGGDCQIEQISPDTIWFGFDDLAARDIPIQPPHAEDENEKP